MKKRDIEQKSDGRQICELNRIICIVHLTHKSGTKF